jgi:hypothetical protein
MLYLHRSSLTKRKTAWAFDADAAAEDTFAHAVEFPTPCKDKEKSWAIAPVRVATPAPSWISMGVAVENSSEDRVRLSVGEAQTLSESVLMRTGYDAEEARIIADHVIDAALCGYEYSGLPKILNVVEHELLREPRRRMRALRETPNSVLYDGGNNNGMVTISSDT